MKSPQRSPTRILSNHNTSQLFTQTIWAGTLERSPRSPEEGYHAFEEGNCPRGVRPVQGFTLSAPLFALYSSIRRPRKRQLVWCARPRRDLVRDPVCRGGGGCFLFFYSLFSPSFSCMLSLGKYYAVWRSDILWSVLFFKVEWPLSFRFSYISLLIFA